MDRFEGKTVLVTGGTSGIGLATAVRLAKEGAQVVVTGSRTESLERARKVLGDRARYVKDDAGARDSGEHLSRALGESTSRLDAAFLNAGIGRFAPLEATDADLFDLQAVHPGPVTKRFGSSVRRMAPVSGSQDARREHAFRDHGTQRATKAAPLSRQSRWPSTQA